MIALSSCPNPTPILFGQGLQSKVHLFQISTLSFCLCPHPPPGIISAWSQGQIFTSPFLFWTHSLCSWLLVFFSGSKCRRYFSFHISCPLDLFFFLSASHPYSIHPASFSSPFISLTFQLCQSALSLDPFWKRSHAFGSSSHFCYIPRLFFHPNVALFLLF